MNVRKRLASLLTAVAILTAGVPLSASASPEIPFAGDTAALARINSQLDTATARVLEIEAETTALRADNAALEERIAVTAERIRGQREALQLAEEALAEAKARFETRIIVVYKRGTVDPFSLLFSAESIGDLFARASLLSRLAEEDGRVVSDLNLAAADARYQASVLDDLRAQDVELRRVQQLRLDALDEMLAEQESLIANLTEEAHDALLAARRLDAETRKQWRDSSIPDGTIIERAEVIVLPDRTFLASAYMPRTYRATGESFTAVCSWYGNEFDGRPTACGQIFNEDDFTCASRTLPFGTVLALTRGARRIIVVVTDRGPFVAGRDLDLSKAAAAALGFSGVATVQAEIVIPAE